jgi:hypothetical protein
MQPGSQSGILIGTHSWYLLSPDGSGSVIIIYNNSLFQLFASDYNLAESSARSIVNDLTEGINGVVLGKEVKVPKISDVVMPDNIWKNEKFSLKVKASDPFERKLSFIVLSSKGQLVETDKPNKKFYLPHESGSDELKVYTINEANVVSSVFVKKVNIADQK